MMPYFQSELGVGYKLPEHLVFFGNKIGDFGALSKEFPHISFRRVRQTHSSIVAESSGVIQEADAHYTGENLLAPVVATADCIPLMIFCRHTKRVAAVHAGWRGVQNQITVNTLNTLKNSGSVKNDFTFYIGPHIRQNSFETDEDVFSALSLAHPDLEPEKFTRQNEKKYYIDLSFLVRYQIEKYLNSDAEIFDVLIDTKTNDEFHSYRRDKELSGRNLNFIVKL
jgi:YfiH family protein